ncbi:MAG TPA: TonB-dependent receptor [Woeseiaceae bacterium]|nr:TonB-dependent receptor [Woeseiaceae bacterium]
MSRRLPVFTVILLLSLTAPFRAHGQDDNHAHDEHAEEMEEIVVQATRSGRRIQDEPIRVEVLSQEEIAEKLLMRPGNISMMLNETGGLRVQVTSPALGSANVRIYGMRGRYTQLLADGMPLYGGQASSLGLLQVPPSDLGQVEVIKGAASALYGGQALGGVINLVSKRPGPDADGEIIVNATTRDGQDYSVYVESPFGRYWSGSLLSNYNQQSVQDLDGDDWIDMPGYERFSARPRLFYDGPNDFRIYLTAGAMAEDRRGGTVSGGVVPDGAPFQQNQDTRRYDAGLVLERPVAGWGVAQLRASGTRQSHDHRFGTLLEVDQHKTMLIEASVTGDTSSMSWVGGLAHQVDDYDSETFPIFNYHYNAPALFAQLDRDLGSSVSVAASARWDKHSEYGDKFSPRLSLLYRPGSWTIRASWGRGFYAPTPFIEETEAAGLSRLEPLSGLVAETAETASLDIGYTAGNLEAGLTLFGSNIDDAVRLQAVAADEVRLANQDGVTRTRGVEALVRWRRAPYVVTASYLYLDASEPEVSMPGYRTVPLTPRHSAGIVAMWEEHDRGRVGLELYYTGKQALAENPYRNESEPYLHIGLLGEIVLGRYRLFLNLENILDVRQTKEDSLLLPTRAANGLWTVDAWEPLEGFIANAGIRIGLGGTSR